MTAPPRLVTDNEALPADEATMADELVDALAEVRAGNVRSVFVSYFTKDGRIVTGWSATHGDKLILIGPLAALQHDILASRSENEE